MNANEACNALLAYLTGEGRNDVLSVGGFLPSSDPSYHAISEKGKASYVYSAMPLVSAELGWPATVRIRIGEPLICLAITSIRIGHASVAFSSPADGNVVHEFQLSNIRELELRRASDKESRMSQLGKLLDLVGDPGTQ